ncbi:MAG TPA: sugar-binding protein [Planctomycetota bacterium]
MRAISTLFLVPLLALAACSGDAGGQDEIQLAFVVNGPASFWTIAERGVAAAEADFNVRCDVRVPAQGVVDQKRIVEDLLTRNVDGIAISPIDGKNQAELIDQACARTKVITHDSDAPGTKRLCYVGMDNYRAGRMCGELVKEALPDGGSVMLFVGRIEQDNARRRRQGVIDELLGRSEDGERFDPPGSPLEGNGFTILDTRTDQFDQARAKGNAEDALARHPDLDGMIGLFAYNPPACLEALRGAGKLGQVQVIAFDEDDATLQGIADGFVYGTVVQQPYQYGYQSVRILAALVRGEDAGIPASGFVDVPAKSVRRANVAEFRAELARLLGEGE